MDDFPEPLSERDIDIIDKHDSEIAHITKQYTIRELQQFLLQSNLQDSSTSSTDSDLLKPLNSEQEAVLQYFKEFVSKPLEETKGIKHRVLLTGK